MQKCNAALVLFIVMYIKRCKCNAFLSFTSHSFSACFCSGIMYNSAVQFNPIVSTSSRIAAKLLFWGQIDCDLLARQSLSQQFTNVPYFRLDVHNIDECENEPLFPHHKSADKIK